MLIRQLWFSAVATLGLIFCLVSHGISQAFSDVTLELGVFVFIDGDLTGNGVSAYDWNKDGYDDLSFCTVGEDPKFFENQAGSGFLEVDPFFSNSEVIRQISWVDYDNDGDADIFATFEDYSPKLFENDGELNFSDISEAAGFPVSALRNYGFCWGDYDEDGYLDVFVSTYWDPTYEQTYELENHLYRNNGDGTFIDVTLEAGVSDGHSATLCAIWMDYNNDGQTDLFVVNDKCMPNVMYRNDGNGSFTDVSVQTNTNQVLDGMTATVGDLNLDGWLDIYVTNTADGNLLLLNDGTGSFEDISASAGVFTNESCWAANWIDYDNNGYLDLHVCTQGAYANGQWQGEQNYFYINNEDETFTFGSSSVGLGDDNAHSYCTAIGDFNDDGYPDMAMSNLAPFAAQIWQNSAITNRFIEISLEGTVSNRDAVGSTITAWAAGQQFVRQTYCGENYLGQNSQHEIIGLGNITILDSVIVDWPNGLHENFGSLGVNISHLLVEGNGAQIPVVTADSGFILCEGSTVTLATGEFASINWSTGDETQSIVVDVPGEYWVETVDANGFLGISQVVTIASAPQFVWQVFIVDVACAGDSTGTLDFNPAGQSGPYQDFIWFNEDSSWTDQSLVIEGLMVGEYNLSFTDLYGCSWNDSVEISEPEILVSSIEATDVSCFGLSDGQAIEQTSGGTAPYTFDWDGQDNLQLSPGEFQLIITDSLGCISSVSFFIDQPEELLIEILTQPITADAGGSAEVEISGGTEPYDINWGTGEDSEIIVDLPEGNYDVTITDSNGCGAFAEILLTSIAEMTAVDLVIYPVPVRDRLYLESPFQIEAWQILELDGSLVEERQNLNQNRSINTSKLSSGQYILKLLSGGTWFVRAFVKE